MAQPDSGPSRTISTGTVQVAGRTIAYRRAGSGPPVLFLHGGWSDADYWRRQLQGLSDEFDVIAWDAPGCGRSSDPPAGHQLGNYADDVAALVDALGIERPHLVGLSFGGGLAIAVQGRHPDLARSLVLAAAYAGWAGSLDAEEIASRVDKMRGELDRPPQEWAASYLPTFFANPVPQEIVDEVTEAIVASRPAGVSAMIEAFATADLRDVLPTIDVPTLLLYGDKDVRSPMPVAEALHRSIPKSTLQVLRGIGHCSNLEAPDAFNAAVRAFLRSAE